ncbi:oviduct-specific glyco protein, partial [Microdochium bolleyi]
RWGFCGMTKDFCEKKDNGATGGCQSNCDQPGPKKKASEQLNRVIGYYEAWRHDSKCQDMGLNDIPVNSLTHLYFSFAFITPGEFNIIGMDGLPDKLFTDFTSLKKKNPGLKTIIAVGGWTHNDPGPLQKVFSNMVSTKETRAKFIKNLLSFLRKYAFDGVDFDWEYPGADDRGGVPEDGVNFTKFLKELDDENNKQPNKYIVSFTVPTSFWYLRHFDLKAVDYTDFVNVMSYDLHGVWDRDNPIGSHIYGHTNLTEMSLAFDLFWRNDVPAGKLNMGLGFYGRAFQLADPSCNKPGCLFKGGATKGACSGESGILSYREIQEVIDKYKIKPVHDKEAGVKYITWNTDQWVSFDDKDTFKQKKDLASKLGLGGFLIWAIDQDDAKMSALSAVLDPKAMGDFKSDKKDDENWTGTNEKCYVTACGGSCKSGEIKITDQKCEKKKKSELCCPLSGAPDPKQCHWRGDETRWCNGHCNDDEVMTHMSKYGGGADCWDGQVAHCCKSSLGEKNVCKWRGVNEKCHAGELPMTFSGTVLNILDDIAKVILRVVGRAHPLTAITGLLLLEVLDALDLETQKLYCCPEKELKKWTNCAWYGKPGNCFDGHCPDMKTVQITDSYFGGGETCGHHLARVRTYCCESDGEPLFLPVPLKNLFEHPPDGGTDTDFLLETDKSSAGGDTDPNEAAFQFVVLVSPETLQISLDKRDGSHWDVFDCNDAVTEGEHTVRMVCTDYTADSNCGKIGLGHGVPGTILQMPKGCGPGKYAVAKTMVPSPGDDHTNLLPRHLSNLAPLKPVVYDLTFDYDFHRVPRDLGNTQMRIDYSNQDEYWKNIVAGSVSRKRDLGNGHAKRTLEDVGGNPVRWLEEEFRDDFHLSPIDKRDLHERWFGKSILEWLAALVKPEIKREFTHKYDDSVTAKLFDESWDCMRDGIKYDGHLLGQAVLDIEVESSFGFTLIVEKLSLPLNLEKSYLTFYNKGKVTGVVTLEAVARMTYEKKEVILNLPFPGASFKIPGIGTIGPQLTVEGSIDASLGMAGLIETKLEIAKWEAILPNNNAYKPELINGAKASLDRTGDFSGLKKPEFYAGVTASGDVTFRLSAAAEFGVRFDPKWKVNPAAAAVVGEVSLTTKFATGKSTIGTCPFTYGLDVGARLFARAQAPAAFGWSGGEVNLTPPWNKAIINGGTCPDLGPIPARRSLALIEGGEDPLNTSVAAPAVYHGLNVPAIYGYTGLSSRTTDSHLSLSKRGAVFGPAFPIPVGEYFCPAADGEKGITCEQAYDSMGANGGEGDGWRVATRKRTPALEAHVHAHQHHHSRHAHHGPHGHPRSAHYQEARDEELLHMLEERGKEKLIKACGMVTDISDDFHPAGKLGGDSYGWQDPKNCNSYDWGGTSGTGALAARVPGIEYHTEHILEAQLIDIFFQKLNKDKGTTPYNNPKQNLVPNVDPTKVSFCDYVNALWDIDPIVWPNKPTTGGIGQPWKPVFHIAAQYPTKTFNPNEFVALESPINTPAKTNAWRSNDPFSTTGWAKNIGTYAEAKSILAKLRSTMGSRIYQSDTVISGRLKTQSDRIADVLDALDTTLLPANRRNGYNAWTKQNLKDDWNKFMKGQWVIMKSKTKGLVDTWLDKLESAYTTPAEVAKYQAVATDSPAVAAEKLDRRNFIKAIEDFRDKWENLPAWTTPF